MTERKQQPENVEDKDYSVEMITVSPPTNFLIKAPTIIGHDEHEFLFSGFSMFSHYKLAKLPTCKVIRFNIEYTILYEEEPAPQNFTIQELDLFEEYLFYELLELVDLDLGKATGDNCSQFHFMPRFVRFLPEGGCEVLSMCEVLKYLLDESGLLIPPEMLEEVHEMDHYTWQKFVDGIKGMIVTYPGKKPCSVRVDQLDRSPPPGAAPRPRGYYPEIVHFGIRPPQLSYAGNPENFIFVGVTFVGTRSPVPSVWTSWTAARRPARRRGRAATTRRSCTSASARPSSAMMATLSRRGSTHMGKMGMPIT
ncbi:unnamed protein product [Plutella xylostella]|uniref:(diamondback moth) hypothetical protein n=1 Tax=Plutella xylostella TaxID=51655 RepID=A0A8S4DL87_PLUXY|nr:unnamed protein product [Plutella xylostella]